MIGQEDALKAVSNAVRRSRAGLQDASRPIGSFLFLGPTGVGKTELAKSLAEFIFDDEISEEIVVNESIEWIIEEPPSEYIEDTSFVLFIVEPPVNEVLINEVCYHSNQPVGPETEEFYRFVYGYESEDDM